MNNANCSVIAQFLLYFPWQQTQSYPLSRLIQFRTEQVQWNLDITNLYVTKPSVWRTIFFTPVMVKYVKKNLDIANKFCQSLGPSLYRGSTIPRKVTTHLSLPRLHLYNARPSEEYLCGATLEACEWGRERGQGLENFPFTLVGDSGTKVQPNGQKARHWLVNELVTKLKRLTVMLQNERNEVTAKRINSGVE